MKGIRTADDVMNLILEIERKFNPEKWKINNIDIWPVLRVHLYYELTLEIMNIKPQKHGFKQKAFRVLNLVRSLFYYSKKPARVLLASDGISYINMDGYLFERFCDPIIDLLEEKKTTWVKWNLAGTINGKWKYKAERLSGILDYVLIHSALKQNDRFHLDEKDLDAFCQFVNENTANALSMSVDKIKGRFKKFDALVKWYEKQLMFLKPSMVIIVSYYSDRGMALIMACNKLGIRTSDIQHGIQGELHAAYCQWSSCPPGGYNTLPSDFMVWSEFEQSAIERWSVSTPHRAELVGNLFEERWFVKDSPLTNQLDDRLKIMISAMASEKTILFTLQYGLEYEDWIYRFIADTQDEYNWLIRLHPVINNKTNVARIQELFECYKITNYELKLSSSLPLYSLLRNVNLHVTHSSSTVIEAANFGINTLLLSEYGAELYEDYVRERKAYIFDLTAYSSEILIDISQNSYNEQMKSSQHFPEMNSELLTKKYLKKHI